MKSRIFLFVLISTITLNTALAQEVKPRAADEIMNDAYAQATQQNKNVFVMWHASWCGWCHRMDSLMNMPEIKDYFDSNWVTTHLVVKEFGDKKSLENPGAAEMLTKYLGDKSGIPFWIVLDAKGNLLADSMIRKEGVGMDHAGQNSGCPAQQDEVDFFISVLKKTTKLNEQALKKIAGIFIMPPRG